MLNKLDLQTLKSISGGHLAVTFPPEDANTMGKLTSFHARDAGGIKKSAELYAHVGIANELGMDPADGTVKSFMKLSIAWAKSA